MTEPAPISGQDQVLLRLAFIKFVSDAVKAADKEARAEALKYLKKGDTLTARSPIDNAKMVRASMSDPKPVATVTDMVALDNWIRENYADKVHVGAEVIVGTPAEVIAVLREHAPRLLVTEPDYVPGWAINELVTRSQGAGEPVGFGGECGDMAPPGITVRIPDGVLSVTADKTHGKKAFEQLWDAKTFGLDGRVIQLTSSEDPS